MKKEIYEKLEFLSNTKNYSRIDEDELFDLIDIAIFVVEDTPLSFNSLRIKSFFVCFFIIVVIPTTI